MNFCFVKVHWEEDEKKLLERLREGVKLRTFVNKDLPYTIMFTVKGAKEYLRVAGKAGEQVNGPAANKYKLNSIVKTIPAVADLVQKKWVVSVRSQTAW